MIEGKIPAQDIETEELVLGACLIEKAALGKVANILHFPECFYKESNAFVYSAILKLIEEDKPVDISTTTSMLRKMGKLDVVGGAYAVVQLTQRVGSGDNAEFHAKQIYELFLKRELGRVSMDIASKCFDDQTDSFKLLDEAENSIKGITKKIPASGTVGIDSVLGVVYSKYSDVKANGVDSSGMKLHLGDIDEIIQRVQPGDYVVVAARPSMGKTMSGLEICRYNCLEGRRGLVFSLEMPDWKLTTRMLSAQTGIALNDIRDAKLSADEEVRMNQEIGRMEKFKLKIDDKSTTIQQIKSAARREKADNTDLEFIIIDYLQLIEGGDPTIKNQIREQIVSYQSRSLKNLAKELGVVIIALSQLARSAEESKNKEPELKHLRESGSIEQDADMVIFPYRPVYYAEGNSVVDEEGNDISNQMLFFIKKNRDGELGCAKAIANLYTQSITSPDYVSKFRIKGDGDNIQFDNFHPIRVNDEPF